VKKVVSIWLFVGSLFTPIWAMGASNLTARWEAWLDKEVAYIITPKERDVFLSLKSDRERGIFEEAFWLQRDPSPGTPENEFKIEHYRRLEYSDKYFGRGSLKRGRETDRGRIYIILGRPISTERFDEGTQNLTPSELWQYNGEPALGLPPVFYVLFFKRDVMSDFVLYSPSQDGPNRLFQGASQNSYDRRGAYKALRNISAELAEASLTLIPGSGADLSSMSSLASDILLSGIQSLPAKKVQSEWAVAFARNSEIITTEHTANYLPADASVFLHQTDDLNILYTIIEPSRLSMSPFEGGVIAPLRLDIKITGADGGLVHQEEKDIAIRLSRSEFEDIAGRRVAVGDLEPFVAGTFSLSYLLRNSDSNEFSTFEETIVSPERGIPSLSRLLVLYDTKPVAQGSQLAPFVIDGQKLFPNSTRTLAKGEPLQVYFEIYNPNAIIGEGMLRYSVDGETANIFRSDEAVHGRRYFFKTFASADLRPGHYTLTIDIADSSGRTVLLSKERFDVSASSTIPRPWRYDKLYPPASHPYYDMIQGYEYLGLGQPAKTVALIEPLYDKKNYSISEALLLARAYFEMKDDGRVVSVLEPAQKLENAEASLLLGKSLYRLGKFREAIPVLENTMRFTGQTVELLNLMGTSILGIGQKERGLSYLRKSLEMNPNQPEIRKAIRDASK
jgi:GWxTD domain-containing protein